jgi:Leucine-rich repeat (LRR) protein
MSLIQVGNQKVLKLQDLNRLISPRQGLRCSRTFDYKEENGRITELCLCGKPAVAGKPTRLFELNEIPSEIFTNELFRSLEFLEVSENQIKSIPETIGELKSLKSLDLSGNQIRVLPETIGQLENLEGLWIGKNCLSALPESFSKLKALKYLDLSENQFSKLL